MPRRIENLHFEKLVVVVIFDGFSNAIFVGFFYSRETFAGFDGSYRLSARPQAGLASLEMALNVGAASHFECGRNAPAVLPM